MNKKIFLILLCFILIMILSGCWSRKEPKTLAVVTSVIYDIADHGGYHLTAEVMRPSMAAGNIEGDSSGKSHFITVTGDGLSASEAIRNVSVNLERSVFGSHNYVRFVSENLAKKDINPIIDYFLRDFLTNETPLMVVIKGENPERIYSSALGLSDTVGDYMEGLRKTQPKTISKSVFVNTLDFVKDYYIDGKQPVIGVAQLVENESETESSSENGDTIKYEGLAAFKDNKLVGYMDGTETRAYNFVTNNIKIAYITILSGEDVTAVEIEKSNSDINIGIDGDQITMDVKIKINMRITQDSGLINITKQSKKVEESFNKQLEEEIIASIKKAQQEFQSDIFGFGNFVHIQYPEKWKEIKGNWDDYFSKASVNVTIESTVDRSGNLKEPFE